MIEQFLWWKVVAGQKYWTKYMINFLVRSIHLKADQDLARMKKTYPKTYLFRNFFCQQAWPGTVWIAAKAIQQSNLTNDAKPPARLSSGGSAMTTSDGWSLMSEPMRAFIAGIAKCHDEAQISTSWKELIQLMKLLTLATRKQCDNHFDYLVRMKKMPKLKNHGRVQRAQATMTKGSCIQMEQQLWWHNEIESVWEDHRTINQPSEEYKKLQPFFQINLDEAGVLGSTGVLQVVGSAEVKNHEKNTLDNCDLVTIVRIGSAGGTSGPWIFLTKQKELEKRCPLHNLEKNFHQVLPDSKVVCTDNAYMTDKTWVELAPLIAKGICSMPHIKDHPDWQVCLTLDGFSSHLVTAGLETFTAANITIIKEEGDTSQVNQACNQSVAKEDKKVIRESLDILRSHQKLAVIKQETIIVVCIDAPRKVKPNAWVESFKKMNQHPHFWVDFAQWCKRIESKLATRERFFRNRVGLFDAMPAFWKQMSC
jgi:hypothetical protein